MIILNSSTKSLTASLSASPQINNPEFIITYADNDGTTFLEGSVEGTLSGANSVTLLESPMGSFRRIIKDIRITNIDTSNIVLMLQYNNGVQKLVTKSILEPQDTWTLKGTFNKYGSLKTSGIASWGAITGTVAGQTDLQSILDTKVDSSNASNLLGNYFNNATTKSLPLSGDIFTFSDSENSFILKKFTWDNFKATLKTYFDTIFGALSTTNLWTKAQNVSEVPLSFSSTVNTDANLGNVFSFTATTAFTLANPTNLVSGGTYVWHINQDVTGGRLITFDTIFKFPGGTIPALSSASASKDTLTGIYDGAVLRTILTKGFA